MFGGEHIEELLALKRLGREGTAKQLYKHSEDVKTKLVKVDTQAIKHNGEILIVEVNLVKTTTRNVVVRTASEYEAKLHEFTDVDENRSE